MRALVSAASKYGSTLEIATTLCSVLGDAGLDVSFAAPEEVSDIGPYGAVVLGSAVYMGQWMKPAKQLVSRCAANFACLPVWLFSSGPVGDPPTPAKDAVQIAGITKVTGARDHRLFPGCISRQRLSLPERAMAGALGVVDGDYRPWPEIRRWALGIAEELLGPR